MAVERLKESIASTGEPAPDDNGGWVEQDDRRGDPAGERGRESVDDPARGRITHFHGGEHYLCVHSSGIASR